MKYLITIEHPAWAHQFKPIVEKLFQEGHSIKVLVINQEVTQDLLKLFNIKYRLIGKSTGKSLIHKAWIFIVTTIKVFIHSIFYKPDMFIGRASPMVAISAWILRKPHVIYEDTERSVFSLWFCKRISKIIITPKYFKTNLGKNHIKTDSFKELFYLHKNIFNPDLNTLKKMNLPYDKKFILIRFIAWNASHDLGENGLSIEKKTEIINQLSKNYKVLISSEEKLPDKFQKFEIDIPADKIHDVIYFAELFISESGTMSSEACLLGTPVVYIATIAKKLGNFIELREKYNLLYFYDDENIAWEKIIEILETPNFKDNNRKKLKKIFDDKIDILNLYYNIITNYPKSIEEINNSYLLK